MSAWRAIGSNKLGETSLGQRPIPWPAGERLIIQDERVGLGVISGAGTEA